MLGSLGLVIVLIVLIAVFTALPILLFAFFKKADYSSLDLSSLGFIVRITKKIFINSFQFLFLISILFEILHNFIPNRAFEYYDLLANTIGVVLAYLVIKLILKKKI